MPTSPTSSRAARNGRGGCSLPKTMGPSSASSASTDTYRKKSSTRAPNRTRSFRTSSSCRNIATPASASGCSSTWRGMHVNAASPRSGSACSSATAAPNGCTNVTASKRIGSSCPRRSIENQQQFELFAPRPPTHPLYVCLLAVLMCGGGQIAVTMKARTAASQTHPAERPRQR